MATLKTKETVEDVDAFIARLPQEQRRAECRTLLALMRGATKAEPKMWSGNIIGFGNYRYRYESGREGEWFLTGFSPRKAALTLYLWAGFESEQAALKRLGKHKTGRGCLYLRSLEDVDLEVLQELILTSLQKLEALAEQYRAAHPERKK